ncbi:MAG TPA: hypothetical protein VEQ58_06495 [Polyangiaceae bacterium]|nr:hypothetical protein [Polyangiaceae bacterium]
MASGWHVLQECGWPSWISILAGLLAFALSAVALCLALLRRQRAILLAWLALALSLSPSGVGAGGMVIGRSRTDRIVDGGFADPSALERIREEGYREARSCLAVGSTVTVLPLLLAVSALAAAYALRRK